MLLCNTAPNWEPIIEPVKIQATNLKPIFPFSKWVVAPYAEVNIIWKRSVPMATLVGTPNI